MCIIAFNSPSQPHHHHLNSQGNRGSGRSSNSPWTSAMPDRSPLPPGGLRSLVYWLAHSLARLGSGRVGSARGRVSPPAKRRKEQPKVHSQRPRRVGWHSEEGRRRAMGSRESGMGTGMGAGPRAGEGDCRRARAAAAPCPHGLGAPWERQDGKSGRPAREGTLTADREPGRGQQLRKGAQQHRRRHVAGPGSASPAVTRVESAPGRAPPGGRRRGNRRLRSRAEWRHLGLSQLQPGTLASRGLRLQVLYRAPRAPVRKMG